MTRISDNSQIVKIPWGRRVWRFAQAEWFALTTLFAVGIAYCLPWLGDKKGPFPIDMLLNGLIALLLFLTGLKLPTDELVRGATSWRVHAIVQFVLLVLNPLVVWLILSIPLVSDLFAPEILNGILLTQAMATTTSTCVIFTAAAGGNEAAAIFNATLSNGLGILTGPFLAWLLMSREGGSSSGTTKSVLEKLAFIILLPFFFCSIGTVCSYANQRIRQDTKAAG
jgi:sodium/bile acid cotransporter 7